MTVSAPPAQAVELAPLPLGGAAGAPLAEEERRDVLPWRWGRTAVDHALGGDRCADPLVDQPDDLEVAGAPVERDRHPVAHADRRGRLGGRVVDAHVSTSARIGGSRA